MAQGKGVGACVVHWGGERGVESYDMSPDRQGLFMVTVPDLIRPKYGFNTVSRDRESWDGM